MLLRQTKPLNRQNLIRAWTLSPRHLKEAAKMLAKLLVPLEVFQLVFQPFVEEKERLPVTKKGCRILEQK